LPCDLSWFTHSNDGSGFFHATIGPLPKVVGDNVKAANFPFRYTEAKRRQGNNIVAEIAGLRFVKIPAGEFVMGSVDGFNDERPRAVVKIEKPFWICETEITNGQYALFDPEHDTGYESEHGFDHISPGYIANHPDQPVARELA
jgi:formylglycine-generating enzyme required for sulfatase activity